MEFFALPEQYRLEYGPYRTPLLFTNGTRVQTPADWQRRRRQEIRSSWHQIMGPWPALIAKPSIEVVKTMRREDILQQ